MIKVLQTILAFKCASSLQQVRYTGKEYVYEENTERI